MPGDDRGWIKWQIGHELPQPLLTDWCRDQMTEFMVLLDARQRQIVNHVIAEHCDKRGWHLYAVNCRSNHCHVVVTASEYDGEQVRDQLKGWAKRRLKEDQRSGGPPNAVVREHWWTRKGSVRYVFDEASLSSAIAYTMEAQEVGGSKHNS
jgi:REP element-mobilizing transposase RayT